MNKTLQMKFSPITSPILPTPLGNYFGQLAFLFIIYYIFKKHIHFIYSPLLMAI